MWDNCWAHVIGSTVATGYFALVIVFGPRLMLDQSWRSEMINYEDKRMIEGNTTERVFKAGADFDHISSVANLSSEEVTGVVAEYAEAALPGADVLTVAGKVFEPRWNESNARGALMENVMLVDNDLAIFPTNLSQYFCTIVFLFGVVVSGMVVASMIYIYQRALMALLGYLACLKQEGLSKESAKFFQLNLAREVVRLALSALFALFCLALVTVFGWLESNKAWSCGDSLYWGTFTFTAVGHSPVLPTYMMGRPQMTTWLSLCNFCMHLQTNASIGLLILSVLRCWDARNSLQTVRLSDLETRAVLTADHERIIAQDNNRPRFHN